MLNELRASEGQHVVHHVADTQRLERHVAGFQEVTQATNHLAGADVIGDDVFEDVSNVLKVYGFLGEQAFRRLRVAENGRERLIQLVRKGARELAEHGHSSQMRHLLAALQGFRSQPSATR